MNNILFVTPISGNGGIVSWSKKMIGSFSNDNYKLIPVNISYRRSVLKHEYGLLRIIDGLIDFFNAYFDVKNAIKKHNVSILHTTTSGNIGCLRDLFIGRLAKKNNIPTILHCHYGCITNDYMRNGIIGFLLRKSLRFFDQIWVLDKTTFDFLRSIQNLKDKVCIAPNFIDVPLDIQVKPKKYKRIAFIGNLIKSKGLFEVIYAVKNPNCDIVLDIVGPGRQEVVDEMMQLIGDDLNKKIFVHGRMNNKEVIRFMNEIDIIALPSFYHSEAFPISILEAMSLGKMVISTRRAAIPDMLTDIDGNACGYFVREHSADDIVEGIKWCQDNSIVADEKCLKAYEKVKTCYSTEIVYDLYRSLYRKLI